MVRQAGKDDIQSLAELWARAFPGDRTVEQRARQLETGGVFGGLETAWLAETHGRVTGAFRAYSLTQHMHGAALPMMGLAAVAVDETARRRGAGRDLCGHAVRVARQRGDLISVLFPFRPSFYQALGWGYVGRLESYRFRPESLALTRQGDVARAGSGDISAVAACYARIAASSNGLISRTPRIWRQHAESDGAHIYVTGSSAVEGYVIVRHGRASSPEERPLFIVELLAETEHAYSVLLGWLASQRDSWRVMLYDAAPDEHFGYRLSEPRPPGFRPARDLWAPVARVLRGPMLRVLDVPAALERRVRWGGAAPMCFQLEVADDMVQENRGPFVVDHDGSRVTVSRGTARAPALRLRADTFAQLFAGELSLAAARALGLAEVDGDAWTMDALFRTEQCFRMLDEF